jgi:DNA-binding NarL/FixJ family response regulator
MKPEVRVVLADDHALVREMLHDQLAGAGIEVAGTAASADAAHELCVAERPDVVIMDIDMPGRSAFDVAREIRVASPGTRVIYLSAYIQDRYIERALEVEAAGYLSKTEPPGTVANAVVAVAGGATWYSPEVLARIVIDAGGARLDPKPIARFTSLTDREEEVLGYVSRGMQQKQIARLMGLSVKTVQHHIAHIMDKLDIHDRVELARFAIREGVVEP